MASHANQLPALIIGRFGDHMGLKGLGVEKRGEDVFFEMCDAREDE